MFYLSQHCGFNQGTEIAFARFVQFLTGKHLDNITQILRNPLKVSSKNERGQRGTHKKKFTSEIIVYELRLSRIV
jgi:hypothetical protein